MNVQTLESFVTQAAKDAGLSFTLDGERITPTDLGDPNCLLPLVVATMQKIHGETGRQLGAVTSVLQVADPQTHMLGWKIKSLPDAPDGALLLLANHAVRSYLANAPQPKLTLPSIEPIDQVKGGRCELRPHLEGVLGLQKQRNTPQQNATPGR